MLRLTAHAFPTLGGDIILGAEASVPGVAGCTFHTLPILRIGFVIRPWVLVGRKMPLVSSFASKGELVYENHVSVDYQ